MQSAVHPPENRAYSFPTLEAEDMKLRDGDKKWLSDEIADQIGRGITQAIDEFRPHGWRRVTHFLREWGIAGTMIAAFVALFGIALGGVYQSVANVREETKFRTETGITLTKIGSDIQAIKSDLAKQSIINHASLPVSEFKATLSDISGDIAAAKQQKVKISAKILDDLQQKLIVTGASAPGFWPATAEFISYRSQVIASDLGNLVQPNLPNCTNHEPSGMRVTSITPLPGAQETVTVENARYSDCRMTLDSPEDNEKINAILRHKAARITFTHCLIVYKGGAINLILEFNNDRRLVRSKDQRGEHVVGLTSVSGPTLEFDNCLLDFSLAGQPDHSGQQFTEALLAQNGSKVILPPIPSTHS